MIMKKLLILLLIPVMLIASACSNTQSSEANQNDDNSTDLSTEDSSDQMLPSVIVAVVVAQNDYQEREFWPVYETLIDNGIEVVVVSEQEGTAKSGADSVEVDIALSDLFGGDVDGVVVIGGTGVQNLWDNTELQRIIREADSQGKIVAAICLAPVTLANADAIESGDTACWYSNEAINTKMNDLGVVDSKQSVTVNENVITANGPDAAQEFADEIVNTLKGS